MSHVVCVFGFDVTRFFVPGTCICTPRCTCTGAHAGEENLSVHNGVTIIMVLRITFVLNTCVYLSPCMLACSYMYVCFVSCAFISLAVRPSACACCILTMFSAILRTCYIAHIYQAPIVEVVPPRSVLT